MNRLLLQYFPIFYYFIELLHFASFKCACSIEISVRFRTFASVIFNQALNPIIINTHTPAQTKDTICKLLCITNNPAAVNKLIKVK